METHTPITVRVGICACDRDVSVDRRTGESFGWIRTSEPWPSAPVRGWEPVPDFASTEFYVPMRDVIWSQLP